MKKLISITLAVLLVVVGMVSVNVTAAGVPTATLCSASLSLEDSVYIWFDMFFENVDRDADDYGMIFWTSEQTSYTYEAAQGNAAAVVRDKAAGEWSHDSTLNRDVVTYKYGVSAKEMADVVYAQGYAKVGESYYYSSVVPYSVVKYASNKLGLTPGVTGTDDENLKTLLRNMLEYGAAAQIYFGYNTDNLANAVLSSTPETTYTVKFVDFDGTVLKTETVKAGQSATAPDAPSRDGYVFAGWDKEFVDVTGDLTVTAVYTEITKPTIIVQNVTARAGDEDVAVTIALKKNPGISSIALTLDYDKSALTLTGFTYNKSIGGQSTPFNPTVTAPKLVWVNGTADANGDWIFATLYFNVSDTAAGDCAVKVTYDPDDVYNISEDNIDFDIVNGGIRISE